jgi:Zn-dependent protease
MNIDIAQVFITFIVLLFSLTVHEMSHAWTADRLGDPTARLLGRVSLNPMVHADLIGTVIFPLVALTTGAPIIGWAKPVPVNIRQLSHPRRDYVLVAAAGPASNLVLAFAAATVLAALHATDAVSPQTIGEANVSVPLAAILSQAMRLNVLLAVFNMIPIPPLDGGNVLSGLLPYRLAAAFNQIRPYGFLVLYALILTGGFDLLVVPPYLMIVSWLPTQ